MSPGLVPFLHSIALLFALWHGFQKRSADAVGSDADFSPRSVAEHQILSMTAEAPPLVGGEVESEAGSSIVQQG
jgi:hypothetical protein